MGFSRQEYWSGLPCPSSGDLPNSGIEPVSLRSPALVVVFFITSATWEVLQGVALISNRNKLKSLFYSTHPLQFSISSYRMNLNIYKYNIILMGRVSWYSFVCIFLIWLYFFTFDLSGSDPSSPHSWVDGENLGGHLTVATRPRTHRPS